MLTTAWSSAEEARAWLGGDDFARTNAVLQSIEGTATRFEQYRDGVAVSAESKCVTPR